VISVKHGISDESDLRGFYGFNQVLKSHQAFLP